MSTSWLRVVADGLAGVHDRWWDHGDGRAGAAHVFVVAPVGHVHRPRCAHVVHVVAVELQRDLLEVVVVVRRQLGRVARSVGRIEVVDHQRAAPEDPAEATVVVRDVGERIDPDAVPGRRIGPRRERGDVRIGLDVVVGVPAPASRSTAAFENTRTTTPADGISIALSPGGTTATVSPTTSRRSSPADTTAEASAAGNNTMYSSG